MHDKKSFISHPAATALTPAWRALENNDFAEALRLAAAYLNDTNAATHLEAARVAAAARFNLGQFTEALPLFTKIAEKEPTLPHWASVLNAAALAKNTPLTELALSKIEQIYNDPSSKYTAVDISFHYILFYFIHALCDAGNFDRAFIELNRLRRTYEIATVTDERELHSKGMPDFTSFLGAASRVLVGFKNPELIREWFTSLAEKIDPAGNQKIAIILHTITSYEK